MKKRIWKAKFIYHAFNQGISFKESRSISEEVYKDSCLTDGMWRTPKHAAFDYILWRG